MGLGSCFRTGGSIAHQFNSLAVEADEELSWLPQTFPQILKRADQHVDGGVGVGRVESSRDGGVEEN